jgi:hypothetical protein
VKCETSPLRKALMILQWLVNRSSIRRHAFDQRKCTVPQDFPAYSPRDAAVREPPWSGRQEACCPAIVVSRTYGDAYDHDSPQAASRARKAAFRPGRPGLCITAVVASEGALFARRWRSRRRRQTAQVGQIEQGFGSPLSCLAGGRGVASGPGRCARLSACRRDFGFLPAALDLGGA